MLDRWSVIVDECLNKIGEKWPDPPALDKPSPGGKSVDSSAITGILYSGNMHETVPKHLLLDNRLTPLERNGWQVFKMLLDKQGFAAPRYEDLQPYLSMNPYGEKASKETVAKVIHILRLTRWLSLISKGRDKKTGRHLGSIYILHDDPITPTEALQLDSNYLNFVDNCCKHANKNVSIVAKGALNELKQSDHNLVQTRLQLLAQRIQRQNSADPDKIHQYEKPTNGAICSPVRNSAKPSLESELSENSPVRTTINPSSESELPLKPPICNEVRNPNSYSTSTVLINNSTSTVLNHPLLNNITQQQRHNLTQIITDLDTQLINQVITEFEQRCSNGSISNPIGYLFGLLKKAKNNEFKPWLTTTNTPKQPDNIPTQAPCLQYRRDTSQPVPIEIQQQLQGLKQMLANRNRI